MLGASVGVSVGISVFNWSAFVGTRVEKADGAELGAKVGTSEGTGVVGEGVNTGTAVGSTLGTAVGTAVGATVGGTEGMRVLNASTLVGEKVGTTVGAELGSTVGTAVGAKLQPTEKPTEDQTPFIRTFQLSASSGQGVERLLFTAAALSDLSEPTAHRLKPAK